MNRLDLIGIAFVLAAIVFSVYGLTGIQSNTEDVLQWLPDQSEARKSYNIFVERFDSDDFLIVTWDDCTIDDDRLREFSQHIEKNDSEGLVRSLTSGADIASRLSRELNLSQTQIKKRLRGVFFGIENPELTCILIEISNLGAGNRRKCMDLVWAAIDQVPGLENEQVTIGGYPYIATFIDGQLKNSFRYFLLPSIVLATLISFACMRNLVLTLIVFIVAVGASVVSVAFIPFCGCKMGGLMSIIPALVFVLATSGSVHLIRYSLTVIGDVRKLLEIGWRPCTVSAATTAVGMLSLTRSDFPAIRNFGLFCAVGVGFALAFQLVLVPWLLTRFGQSGLRILAARNADSHFWQSFVDSVFARKYSVVGVSVVAMALGVVGLTRLHAQVEVEKLFRPNSKIIQSLSELEQRFGPMDQTEVLLVFEGAEAEQFPDRVKYVRRVQSALAKLPQIGVAYSLTSYLPLEPSHTNARSFARRSTYRSILRNKRKDFSKSSFLFIDDESETWRISLRFPFTRESDFGQLADDVASVAASFERENGNAASSKMLPKLIYTGKTHLFHHAQLTLLQDLFLNFLLAFVIITPILIVVLRSVPLGLIAMLPNLFPTLVVFGGLGWFDYPVDLAIAMTASVALGIAVDDTTHFLIRFRDFGGSLRNIGSPIHRTIGQCGPAMLHTTLIACGGMIVYYFSDMFVVSKFAIAISSLLTIALIADVVMLPAILFLFVKSRKPKSAKQPNAASEDQLATAEQRASTFSS